MRALIIGCGYAGIELGQQLAVKGHEVWGLRRSAEADGELTAAGIQPLRGDITRGLDGLEPRFDWVINVASSSRGGVDEYREVYLEGNRRVLEWLNGSEVQKYVYTSSTSVYGQIDGSEVDESSATAGSAPTSQILIETERLILDSRVPAVVLRVAGIYGPGRGHLFQQFVKGEAMMRGGGESYINMIHREDLGSAIVAALEGGRGGQIYNVCDDEPVRQRDFFSWLSGRLRRPMPPEGPADPIRKRGVTNKRVLNRKLRDELGWQLRYPTFREGYAAEVARITAEDGNQ